MTKLTPALFLLAALALPACGTKEQAELPPTATSTPAEDAAFAEVQPTIDRVCGKCHNDAGQKPVFNSAAKFKAGRAKARLSAGTMPPGGKIDPADKAALLAYLGG